MLQLATTIIVGMAYSFVFYVVWNAIMWLLWDWLNDWKELKEMFDAGYDNEF